MRGRLVLAVGLAACAVAVAAGAAIVSTSGQVTQIAPPPSVAFGALESNTTMFAFDEQQDVTLPSDVKVDITTPGTYDDFVDLTPGTIPAGTCVRSHFVHADAIGNGTTPAVLDGSVTTDSDILGIALRRTTLDATDFLGAPVTTYPTGVAGRQLELDQDDVLIEQLDKRTVTIHSDVHTAHADQVRIITGCGGPPPQTFTISGTKHQDTLQGVGLPGWTIHLYNSGNALIGTDVTDGSGNYSFGGLSAGTYKVCEVLQAGWTEAAPASGPACTGASEAPFGISVTVGPDSSGNDFANTPPPGACVINSSIKSNFNGTPISSGNFIWFNSVIKATGVPTSAIAHITFTNQTITFTANSTPYTLNVPDTLITFSPSATTATTTFNTGTNTWETTVPSSLAKNVFLSGLAYQLPVNFPGGINPVTWSGTFSADTAGVGFSWKWGAAVYTSFSSNYNALGVKPVDGSTKNPYHNSDHAGTPENFKSFVTGGARGGGGSNFTGSYSATASGQCP